MKKITLLLSMIVLVFTFGCQNGYQGNGYSSGTVVVNQPSNNTVVTPTTADIGQNLDLQALGELVKSSANAQDIENKLNQPNSINNLDLNGDGNVDYITVTEYGDPTQNVKGFSFVVYMNNGDKQEVATVELQQGANQQVVMNINGNNNVYGNGAYYSSNYSSMRDLMIMSYLFAPHRIYASPYHYGYYPSAYHVYGRSSYSDYSSRTRTFTKTTKIIKSSKARSSDSRDPNRGYNSKALNSERINNISNPQKSQKSFSVRDTKTNPNTNGFGNKVRNNNSYSRLNGSGSLGSNSKSSFGLSSNKSSFGSS